MRFTLIVVLLLCSAIAAYAADIAESAIREARRKQLYEDPYWETLLHFKTGWFDNYRSLIDDPRFFLSVDGKTNKQSEMEATIRALLSPSTVIDESAACKFPARAAWLQENLDSLNGQVPDAACPHFDNITSTIRPASATLIFPFFSLGDPGSMFGHTMLRLEPEKSAPLLGYAVTYAADGGNSGAIDFVFKGMLGGFNGLYSVLPYSRKLNEYAAIGQRDVWEYELNFTPEEVWRMYLHIWEMSLVTSEYYFFDENCAYNLLFFLEAARPGVFLTDGYFWVLPVDTIRGAEDGKLVGNINFIPALNKRMEAMANALPQRGVDYAWDIADGKQAPGEVRQSDFSQKQQIAILDLSSELVREKFQEYTPEELPVYRQLSFDISTARAGFTEKNIYDVARPTASPEQGHNPSRLRFGAAYADSSPVFRAEWRPVYHSLIDNPVGYLEGGHIEVFATSFKYYAKTGKFNLEHLKFLELTSLAPTTRLAVTPSWQTATGIKERTLRADRTHLTPYINFGGGLSTYIKGDILVWALAMGTLEGHASHQAYVYGGIGGYGGMLYSTGDFGKILAEGTYTWYSDRGTHKNGEISLRYAFYPALNHALTAEVKWVKEWEEYLSEYGISYSVHF